MRKINEIIKNNIEKNKNFFYCFDILTNKHESLYLTSCDVPIRDKGLTFIPNSGLDVKQTEFDDNAQNHMLISGIYETGGIEQSCDIKGSIFKVYFYFGNNIMYHFLTYYCSFIKKFEKSFELKLEPETVKYGRPALTRISKTCRAALGDRFCSVDMQKYASSYRIQSVSGNIITLEDMNKHEQGYFTSGKAFFDDNTKHEYRIKTHYGNNIEIANYSNKFLKAKNITLFPGCDKEFKTCCNKFNNAINFRGEPFLPDYKTIKIF